MGETKNAVVTAELKGSLALQNKLLGELDKAATEMGHGFTEYGKTCMINAIAGLVVYCKNEGVESSEFDSSLLKLAIQNVGYTELNIAAIPSECFLDIRNGKDGKKTVKITPQGAGYEKLLRTYGVGVKEVRSPWLVREGDDFVFPSYDGLQVNPPKWTPKSYDKKVIMVVYPIIKTDGSVEYLISTRDGIKANLVAQIRNAYLYKPNKDEIYKKINEDAETKSLDEILSDPYWAKILNPTYISYSSREAMIIRKMKNNATKNYPKEYRDAYMAESIKNMFEDVDESLVAKKDAIDVDPVEKVEHEIAEDTSGEEAVPDFDADGVKVDANDYVEGAPCTPCGPEGEKVSEPVTESKADTDYGF